MVGGRVLAFEPLAANAMRVRDNLALNDVAAWTDVVPKAVSDREARAELVLRDDFAAGASTGNASIRIEDGQDDRYDAVGLTTVSLDDMSVLDGHRVAVLKLDVEGHEDHVLRGARGILARSRPLMFVEWNTTYHARRGVDPTSSLDDALDGLEYLTVRREGDRWQRVGRFYSPRPIDHLVLVPREGLATREGFVNLPGAGSAS